LDENFWVWVLSNDWYVKAIDGHPASVNALHLPHSDRTFLSWAFSLNNQSGYENCLVEVFDDATIKNWGESIEDRPVHSVLYDAPGIVGEWGILLTSWWTKREGPAYSLKRDKLELLWKDWITPFVRYDDTSLEVVVREVWDRITEQKMEAIDWMNGETLLFDWKTLILSDSDWTEIDRCACTDLNAIDETFLKILWQDERRKYLKTWLLIAYQEKLQEA
jgi:hypothetical protein